MAEEERKVLALYRQWGMDHYCHTVHATSPAGACAVSKQTAFINGGGDHGVGLYTSFPDGDAFRHKRPCSMGRKGQFLNTIMVYGKDKDSEVNSDHRWFAFTLSIRETTTDLSGPSASDGKPWALITN